MDAFHPLINGIQNLVESPKLFQEFEDALKKDVQKVEKEKGKWMKSKEDHKNLEKAKKHIERNQKKLNLIKLLRRNPQEYLDYLKYQINQKGIEYSRNEEIKQIQDTLACTTKRKTTNTFTTNASITATKPWRKAKGPPLILNNKRQTI